MPTVTAPQKPALPTTPVNAGVPQSQPWFVEKTPDFTGLTNDALDGWGTSADGWDAAVAAYEASLASDDADLAALIILNDAADGPAADLLAIGDELTDLIAAATIISDAAELSLFAAIGAMTVLAPVLGSLTIAPLPGLPNLAAPTEIDLTTEISALIQAALPDIEATVESALANWLDSLLGSSGQGNFYGLYGPNS